MIKCLSTSEALVGYSQQLKWRISREKRSICCCGKGDKCLHDEMLETHIILSLVLILLFTFFVSLILKIIFILLHSYSITTVRFIWSITNIFIIN